MEELTSNISEEELRKHLVFRLGKEFYATPLVYIKEITKLLPVKKVPFMVPYYRGILNLRGQIVSVIDLRLKFEVPIDKDSNELMTVVETGDGAIGALVDDIVAVTDFKPEEVTSQTGLKTKINAEFFRGVGRFNDHMINVVDIAGILSQDDYQMIRRASAGR